jgi:3-oxoacyl-[acyl-carrier protein] reductase
VNATVGGEKKHQGTTALPEDVARIAVFLASDDAAFVTGERIMASGGWR